MSTRIRFFGFAHSVITIVTHIFCIMFSIVMWAFQNLSSYPLWVGSQRICFRHQLAIVNFSFNLDIARNGGVRSFTRLHVNFGFCRNLFGLKVFYFVFKVKNRWFIWNLNFFLRSRSLQLYRFTQLVQNLIHQSFLNDRLLLLLILYNILLIHEVYDLICEFAIILKLILLLEIIDYYLMLNLSERWWALHERSCLLRSDCLLLLLLVKSILQLM